MLICLPKTKVDAIKTRTKLLLLLLIWPWHRRNYVLPIVCKQIRTELLFQRSCSRIVRRNRHGWLDKKLCFLFCKSITLSHPERFARVTYLAPFRWLVFRLSHLSFGTPVGLNDIRMLFTTNAPLIEGSEDCIINYLISFILCIEGEENCREILLHNSLSSKLNNGVNAI